MITRHTLHVFARVCVVLFFTILTITRAQAQWTQSAQTEGRFVTATTLYGDTLFTATSDSGVYRSTDNGNTWSAAKTGLPRDILTITSTGTMLFAGRDAGVYRSTNHGGTWTPTNTGLTNPSVYALLVTGTTLLAGTAGNGVFRSTDNGASWTAANAGMTTAIIQALAGGASNMFAGTRTGGVYRSTDNGSTWTQMNTGLTSLNVLALCFTGSDLYMGSAGGGIFRSTNNGALWTPIPTGLTTTTIYSLCVSGANIFAGGLPGGFANVFLSTNNGASWSSLSGVLPLVTINSLTITSTHILAGTAARGIWRLPFSGLTAVGGRIEGEIPQNTSLNQNFPNPFNPSTTIRFELPKASAITLKIFNTLGQEVSVLVNEQKSPGYYQLQWNASVPSGIYFYRLQAGEYVEVRKMVLLR
jgi:photosystem II stability/assembly factor-like uncharacterized protein